MIIRFTFALLTLVIFVGCGHQNDTSDTAVRKNLPGTWHSDVAPQTESKFMVSANGDFECKTTFQGDTNGMQTIELEGTFQVKDGILIETVTKSSQTNAHVPFVSRARVIQADDHEMVISPLNRTNRIVWEKHTS